MRSSGARPLFIRTDESTLRLDGASSYQIGRDPSADIVITDERVSWHHALVRLDGDAWVLEDANSTNGTFLDQERVRRTHIIADCRFRLADPNDGALISCSLSEAVAPDPSLSRRAGATIGSLDTSMDPGESQNASPGMVRSTPPPRGPSSIMKLPSRVLRIGRADDNDVVVADLSVSRHHAELRRAEDGMYEIVDLDSHNGTFVNGERISSALVTERDLIGVGPASFRRLGGELQEFVDTGDISLAAIDLGVTLPGGKVLLDDVSFSLGERCFLGIIGPSGAGKSTLLGALTGMAPANAGRVFYDNRDLYEHYAELRHRIGLVPQDNILHTQLTPQLALEFAAKLRFPADTTDDERRHRIAEVLAELALTKHADTRTVALSGGQQKRVNVALELLTKPSLLLLDEPTSGLDPGLDKSLMEQLADLAHDGRTVIVVTHSVLNLDLCDRLLVLVPGGKIAFFGPPAEGLLHFGQPSWADTFQVFNAEPEREWSEEYRTSSYHDRYIAPGREGAIRSSEPAIGSAPVAKRTRLAHLGTLCRRYLAVIAADRTYLAALLVTPLVLGALARAVPAPLGLTGHRNSDAASVLLVIVVGACFSGAANSVREVVKERSIYTRERATGLSCGIYLASKLIVLGTISAIQGSVIVIIALVGRRLPPTGSVLRHLPSLELLLAVAFLSIVSMTLGLLMSTVVNSSDKTMPLLVVAVMFQVILSGAIFPIAGKVGIEQLAAVAPSRWGFAAVASTANLNVIQQESGLRGGLQRAGETAARPRLRSPVLDSSASSPSPGGPSVTVDPTWAHNAATWGTDMVALTSLGAAFSLLAWWRLRRIKAGTRG